MFTLDIFPAVMKKISILTVGSRGDVEPFIALGKGLERIGYDVQLVTHPDFTGLAEQYHINLLPIRLSAKQFVSQTMHSPKANFFSFVRVARGVLEPLLESVLPDMWLASKDSDVIISSGTTLWGLDIADSLGVPHVLAGLQPLFPTGEFPHVLMPSWFNSRGLINKASYSLIGSLYWQVISRSVNAWRSQYLGFSNRTEPFAEQKLWDEQLHLLGYSPLVIPQPVEWNKDNVHTTGYWRTDSQDEFSPPNDLTAFLSSPRKPVYIGFGSMIGKEDTLNIVLDALHQSGQRGVISYDQNHLRDVCLPPTVLNVESIPHRWLFPQTRAAVHHGGAGTTAAALTAGIPSVAVPFFSEQPFWGKRISALGVGAQPIEREELSASILANVIQMLTHDKPMQIEAEELGHQLRQENGVETASNLVHQYLMERC